MNVPRMTVADAVAEHVHAGDALHLVVGHTRWSAAAREVVRQWWGRDPHFTLVMLSLSSLGALFFRGGLVDRVVTGLLGRHVPELHAQPVVPAGVPVGRGRGRALVVPRVRAAARGRGEGAPGDRDPLDRRIVDGGATTAYAQVDTPFGTVGLLAPLAPDVAILHAPVADEQGNVAIAPPLLEGVWGALAARRGAIVTVEQIVPTRSPTTRTSCASPRTGCSRCARRRWARIRAGCSPAALPVDGYGEDYEFWVEARAATRSDDYDDWIRHWVLEPETQDEYLERLGAGADRPRSGPRRGPTRGSSTQQAYPPDLDAPVNAWETAATFGARHLADRVAALGAARGARRRGRREPRGLARRGPRPRAGCRRAAHRGDRALGLRADARPIRSCSTTATSRRRRCSATRRWCSQTIVGGPGTVTIGCLGGAQVDRHGNVNSTLIPDGPFLVGSGGGNDVASVAAEVVVVATLTPQRTPAECGYVTSPGRAVRALVTDLGRLEKRDAGRRARAVRGAGRSGAARGPGRAGRAPRAAGRSRSRRTSRSCPRRRPTRSRALRGWDPRGWFLRG